MREARPPMERGDFRRRCEAALAHPVTLVALAALLVNDIVLKALFPGAWAMGKLSDLAWVVFAPPLLAFALSFAVPKRSAAGRRAALVVAYGGLPALYAAFNTFAPVHDAIMRVLLIGAESGALGSPMDATDSLVIPFGLALAVWAWRRSAASEGGGTRWRFGLLVAGAAAFASVASSQDPRAEGIGILSATEDGTLIASSIPHFREYISDDGGMSWSQDDRVDREYAVHSSQRVETPRGEYLIGGLGVHGIERTDEYGRGVLVYSTGYLRGDANKWMQENATRNLGYRFLATRPRSILYHAESGNLIAAMGIQGVVVGTPDGRWHRVAVGSYSPTDFSVSGKMRALAGQALGVGAVALVVSLSAMTVAALASAYDRYTNEKDIGFVVLTAFFCLLAFGALMIGAIARDSAGGLSLIVSLAAILTSWIAANRAASKSSKSGDGAGWRSAALSCAATLTLAAMTLFSFGFSDNNNDFLSITVAVTAFVAFIALVPPLAYYGRFIARNWRAFGLAFLGMNALIILSFAMWLTLNLGLIATQVAIAALVGLAAVVLVRHVRGADAGGLVA